ncbi:MAG: type I methionyl aminopeptidase, partial [Cellulomonadaceae bacterium]
MPPTTHRRGERLTPGTPTPVRTVPAAIERPEYVGRPAPRPFTGSEVKSP